MRRMNDTGRWSRPTFRAAALTAVIGSLALVAPTEAVWKSYHDECSAAVLNGKKWVITLIHTVEHEGHEMIIGEICMAGNPPAFNLMMIKTWPDQPKMVDGPHQV